MRGLTPLVLLQLTWLAAAFPTRDQELAVPATTRPVSEWITFTGKGFIGENEAEKENVPSAESCAQFAESCDSNGQIALWDADTKICTVKASVLSQGACMYLPTNLTHPFSKGYMYPGNTAMSVPSEVFEKHVINENRWALQCDMVASALQDHLMMHHCKKLPDVKSAVLMMRVNAVHKKPRKPKPDSMISRFINTFEHWEASNPRSTKHFSASILYNTTDRYSGASTSVDIRHERVQREYPWDSIGLDDIERPIPAQISSIVVYPEEHDQVPSVASRLPHHPALDATIHDSGSDAKNDSSEPKASATELIDHDQCVATADMQSKKYSSPTPPNNIGLVTNPGSFHKRSCPTQIITNSIHTRHTSPTPPTVDEFNADITETRPVNAQSSPSRTISSIGYQRSLSTPSFAYKFDVTSRINSFNEQSHSASPTYNECSSPTPSFVDDFNFATNTSALAKLFHPMSTPMDGQRPLPTLSLEYKFDIASRIDCFNEQSRSEQTVTRPIDSQCSSPTAAKVDGLNIKQITMPSTAEDTNPRTVILATDHCQSHSFEASSSKDDILQSNCTATVNSEELALTTAGLSHEKEHNNGHTCAAAGIHDHVQSVETESPGHIIKENDETVFENNEEQPPHYASASLVMTRRAAYENMLPDPPVTGTVVELNGPPQSAETIILSDDIKHGCHTETTKEFPLPTPGLPKVVATHSLDDDLTMNRFEVPVTQHSNTLKCQPISEHGANSAMSSGSSGYVNEELCSASRPTNLQDKVLKLTYSAEMDGKLKMVIKRRLAPEEIGEGDSFPMHFSISRGENKTIYVPVPERLSVSMETALYVSVQGPFKMHNLELEHEEMSSRVNEDDGAPNASPKTSALVVYPEGFDTVVDDFTMSLNVKQNGRGYQRVGEYVSAVPNGVFIAQGGSWTEYITSTTQCASIRYKAIRITYSAERRGIRTVHLNEKAAHCYGDQVATFPLQFSVARGEHNEVTIPISLFIGAHPDRAYAFVVHGALTVHTLALVDDAFEIIPRENGGQINGVAPGSIHYPEFTDTLVDDFQSPIAVERNSIGFFRGGNLTSAMDDGVSIGEGQSLTEVLATLTQSAIISNKAIQLTYSLSVHGDGGNRLIEYQEKAADHQGGCAVSYSLQFPVSAGDRRVVHIPVSSFQGADPRRAYALVVHGPITLHFVELVYHSDGTVGAAIM